MSRTTLLCTLFIACLAVSPSGAQTRLEGQYEFLVDLRKQDRPYEWDFDSNNNDTFTKVELRLLSTPYPGVEFFLKTEADWNRDSNGNERPRLQYREAHVKFRREYGQRGFEAYLFSRQDRYWVDNQLIQVARNVSDGNGQAIRFDTWGFLGLHTAAIYTDFSGVCINSSPGPYGNRECDDGSRETDDGYVLRLWRPFLQDRLRLGFTYNRRNEREVGDRNQDLQSTEVFAADMRLTLADVDYRLEIARGRENTLADRVDPGSNVDPDSRLPIDALDWRLGKLLSDPQKALPDDIVVRGEIRAFRFGTPRLGFFSVAPSFWVLGPQFRNQMGDGANDEKGFNLNGWYLLPGRAITLTSNYKEYEKEFYESRKVSEFYQEMWTEYVNGFTTKFSYRRERIDRFDEGTGEINLEKHDDLFGEMVVENRLAWLRVQGLIRDLGTQFKKDVMSLETRVNVTNTIKIYNRFTFANDPASQRKGIFSEIQYRPTANVELFLSYGPFWIGGGSDPVREGNLLGSGDQRDLLRLLLKGNF